MEPVEGKMRLTLVLGKFPVTKVNPGLTGAKFTIQLSSAVTITMDAPMRVDVRVGDLLTLYTEVYSAEPKPTSIQ